MKTYTFRVALRGMAGVWRDLELSADHTLEDLHLAIQDAFDFDNDHLYSFFMNNRAWDRSSEYHLTEGVGPWDDFDIDDFGEDFDDSDDAVEGAVSIIMPGEAGTPAPADALTSELMDKLIEESAKEAGIPVEEFRQMVADMEAIFNMIGEEEEGRDVRAAVIDGLGLKKGKKFLYLFDYGDEWRFEVRVAAINPKAEEGDYPRLVASKGDAPPQYPDWNDEDDSDDEDDSYDPDAEAAAIASQPLPVVEYPPHGKITPELKAQISRHCQAFMYRAFWPRLRTRMTSSGAPLLYTLYTHWHGRHCYLNALPRMLIFGTDAAQQPVNMSPARLKYESDGRFRLSYGDAKSKWHETHDNLTLDECFAIIERDERFWP